MKITDFVSKTNTCRFAFYRQKMLYYSVSSVEDDKSYVFPIPVEDLGEASINSTEKSILLMRYIRKAIEDKTLVKYNSSAIVNS